MASSDTRIRRGKIIGAAATNRVLVTGAPRSGTTFLGKALSSALRVDYFHEPLNPMCGLPSVRDEFVDLADDDHVAASEEFARLMDYEPMLTTAMYRRDRSYVRAVKQVIGSRGPFMLRLARVNPWSQHVVVKDPYASLSVRWLSERLDLQPIVVIRHPAAVAASFRRLGWNAHIVLGALGGRPGTLSADELDVARAVGPDPLLSAALVWRVLVRHMADVPSIQVTHEALSETPDAVVRDLCTATGLPYTFATRRFLRSNTSSEGSPADVDSRRAQHFKRDSRSIFDAALAELDEAEIDQVWEITGELASRWYGRTSVSAGNSTYVRVGADVEG